MGFDYGNELEKSKNVPFEVVQEKGKSVNDIVVDFVNVLVVEGVRIPVTNVGGDLLKTLVDARVIRKIDLTKQLELNQGEISVTDVALLSKMYRFVPSERYSFSIDFSFPSPETIKEFELSYGFKVTSL